jgi:hypothetical protein
MILNASSLTDLQACPRRIVLSADWEILKFRPKRLLDAVLRTGILRISQGEDAAEVAKAARAEFLQAAANPGMDTARGADPYQIAMDLCAMVTTILRAAGRMGLARMEESAVVRLNSATEWAPLAFTGEDGLHRIVTIDRWTEDDLVRELHGWFVAGDMAATGLPLTLHVIEIGQQRGGRRASAWARAWRHPTMRNASRLRFLHKDGTTFKGWNPVWLADEPSLDPAAWVDIMFAEGAAQRLWHRIPVAIPSAAQAADTIRQILAEGARASVLISERASAGWRSLPMCRAACDGYGSVPCGWQGACYDTVENLTTTGLYVLRDRGRLSTVAVAP